MKTSARNHFAGHRYPRGARRAVNDEVEIEVRPACTSWPSSPRKRRGPRARGGAQAFALVKASSIVVVTEAEGARFSTRNRLVGTVSRSTTGAVNDEVVIEWPTACRSLPHHHARQLRVVGSGPRQNRP